MLLQDLTEDKTEWHNRPTNFLSLDVLNTRERLNLELVEYRRRVRPNINCIHIRRGDRPSIIQILPKSLKQYFTEKKIS